MESRPIEKSEIKFKKGTKLIINYLTAVLDCVKTIKPKADLSAILENGRRFQDLFEVPGLSTELSKKQNDSLERFKEWLQTNEKLKNNFDTFFKGFEAKDFNLDKIQKIKNYLIENFIKKLLTRPEWEKFLASHSTEANKNQIKNKLAAALMFMIQSVWVKSQDLNKIKLKLAVVTKIYDSLLLDNATTLKELSETFATKLQLDFWDGSSDQPGRFLGQIISNKKSSSKVKDDLEQLILTKRNDPAYQILPAVEGDKVLYQYLINILDQIDHFAKGENEQVAKYIKKDKKTLEKMIASVILSDYEKRYGSANNNINVISLEDLARCQQLKSENKKFIFNFHLFSHPKGDNAKTNINNNSICQKELNPKDNDFELRRLHSEKVMDSLKKSNRNKFIDINNNNNNNNNINNNNKGSRKKISDNMLPYQKLSKSLPNLPSFSDETDKTESNPRALSKEKPTSSSSDPALLDPKPTPVDFKASINTFATFRKAKDGKTEEDNKANFHEAFHAKKYSN